MRNGGTWSVQVMMAHFKGSPEIKVIIIVNRLFYISTLRISNIAVYSPKDGRAWLSTVWHHRWWLQEIALLLIINILQIFVIMHIRFSICSNFIQNFKQSVVSQVFLKSFRPYWNFLLLELVALSSNISFDIAFHYHI